MGKKKPYSERSDLDKLRAQWKKTSGFLEREEWSSAVVRAATAAEIAANHYIREELRKKRGLEESFVDHLLKWSNGIDGKLRNLIVPLSKENGNTKHINALKKKVEEINKVRNSIVHQGQFKKESTARHIATKAREVILGFVKEHKANFTLPKVKNT
ncbi:MAG: hypothetical protein ABW095_05060 [Candidatus Thiodiazotropha sp.]